MKRAILITAALLWAGAAFASWYDDYDAGLAAARNGQWHVVVQKMTAAIAAKGKESDRERTYGAIFITYHPYYYRGVAYLNTGKYQQAVADFEKTSGPGADDYGSLDTLMQRAKSALAQPEPKQPEPKQPEVRPEPKPVPPAVPAIDPALRTRARAALDSAKGELDKARARNATDSPDYQKALSAFTDANTRFVNVKSNDDLNVILAAAENITLLAESAHAPNVPPPPVIAHKKPSGPPPGPVPDAEGKTLEETRQRLHRALESYFNGDFGEAAQRFESLTRDLPNNGWIWAFLGASQYSQYAFEREDSYRASAIESFRKAKAFGKWRDGLPQKYFSRKIRKAFKETAG